MKKEFKLILWGANEISRQVIGIANASWSDYPQVMAGRRIFQKA
jgi:hypothetical protein